MFYKKFIKSFFSDELSIKKKHENLKKKSEGTFQQFRRTKVKMAVWYPQFG